MLRFNDHGLLASRDHVVLPEPVSDTETEYFLGGLSPRPGKNVSAHNLVESKAEAGLGKDENLSVVKELGSSFVLWEAALVHTRPCW